AQHVQGIKRLRRTLQHAAIQTARILNAPRMLGGQRILHALPQLALFNGGQLFPTGIARRRRWLAFRLRQTPATEFIFLAAAAGTRIVAARYRRAHSSRLKKLSLPVIFAIGGTLGRFSTAITLS